MTEAEQIMKRCQAGTRNYEEANNLHAACYGVIGKLLAQQEKDYERGVIDGMQKQMQSSVDKAVNRIAQPEQEPPKYSFKAHWEKDGRIGIAGAVVRPDGGVHVLQDTIDPPEQEPVAYDKTEMNCFVQDLYDKKMKEGKHGHYETMFHVVHQAIKRVPPQRTWVGLAAEDRLTAKYMQDAPDGIEAVIDYIEAKLKEKNT